MNNQFSENLKKIRKDNHLSQEQLAEELGVSRQAISKWESSTAYPEMDKIIALCDKFDLNIDDLLHKDIREIKGEEESKKRLNKTIDDILKFITDTINLFSNMKFKSKVKCLFEQLIIILILVLISVIIVKIGDLTFLNLFGFLPNNIRYFISEFLDTILILFSVISAIIILTHVFKTRYLDYYNKIVKNSNSEVKNIPEKEKVSDRSNKISFGKNENKIIIRDPKHSEYRFINSLFKFIVLIVKFFVLCLVLFICFILIMLLSLLVISFLIYKTGLFFIGVLMGIIALSIIMVIMLLIGLNFIFNRKNNKKKIIWSFIISLLVLGIGGGLMFVGMLNFEMLDDNQTMLETEKIEFDMNDKLFFNMDSDIKYVNTNTNNVKLEYKINKFCEIRSYNQDEENGVYIWTSCSNPTKLAKVFIDNINHKKIISISNKIYDVTVYASKENINKIKKNEKHYFDVQNDYNDEINYYEERIDELEEQISDYEDKFYKYEDKIGSLNEQIDEYKEIIRMNKG